MEDIGRVVSVVFVVTGESSVQPGGASQDEVPVAWLYQYGCPEFGSVPRTQVSLFGGVEPSLASSCDVGPGCPYIGFAWSKFVVASSTSSSSPCLPRKLAIFLR